MGSLNSTKQYLAIMLQQNDIPAFHSDQVEVNDSEKHRTQTLSIMLMVRYGRGTIDQGTWSSL